MARWMVSGETDSAGTKVSRCRSMSSCWVRRYCGRFMRKLSGRLKGFGDGLVASASQRFHACLGLFELLAALFAQAHAAFEEFERLFERKVARLKFADDLLHFLEGGFEFRYRLYGFVHLLHFNRRKHWAPNEHD